LPLILISFVHRELWLWQLHQAYSRNVVGCKQE
jgi:hypothetical protein